MSRYVNLTKKIELLIGVALAAKSPEFTLIWQRKAIELEMVRDGLFIDEIANGLV